MRTISLLYCLLTLAWLLAIAISSLRSEDYLLSNKFVCKSITTCISLFSSRKIYLYLPIISSSKFIDSNHEHGCCSYNIFDTQKHSWYWEVALLWVGSDFIIDVNALSLGLLWSDIVLLYFAGLGLECVISFTLLVLLLPSSRRQVYTGRSNLSNKVR